MCWRLCLQTGRAPGRRRGAGACDSGTYPLQKKRHGLEFLRGIAHLRGRTNVMGAVMRVRSALAQATHAFFAQHSFLYVHTPIISAADCEGAGEMFQVTTLLARLARSAASGSGDLPPPDELAAAVAQQGAVVKAAKAQAKESGSDDDVAAAASEVDKLLKLKGALAAAEEAVAASTLPLTESGNVDYAADFFGRRAFLTVSGQLNGAPSPLSLAFDWRCIFCQRHSWCLFWRLAPFWICSTEGRGACRGDVRKCARRHLHLWADVPSREQQHGAPPCRVLDDRARACLCRPRRRH